MLFGRSGRKSGTLAKDQQTPENSRVGFRLRTIFRTKFIKSKSTSPITLYMTYKDVDTLHNGCKSIFFHRAYLRTETRHKHTYS